MKKLLGVNTFQQFKRLVKVEQQITGEKISLVYEKLAKEYGMKNWNAMSNYLKNRDTVNNVCWNCENTGVVGGKTKRPCNICT